MSNLNHFDRYPPSSAVAIRQFAPAAPGYADDEARQEFATAGWAGERIEYTVPARTCIGKVKNGGRWFDEGGDLFCVDEAAE
jgi:hypothetical protein